jgi:FMN reductase
LPRTRPPLSQAPDDMRIVGVLGSVTPPGRLRHALDGALSRADGRVGIRTSLIDLHVQRVGFADGRAPADHDDDTGTVVTAVRTADAVVLATPVYRGSFTGALKNVLDHLPVEALRGKPVGIVAMGATKHHQLGADWHLRDVLAWFGALAAPTSVYLSSSDFDLSATVAPEAARQIDELLETLVTLAGALPRATTVLGPSPFAARKR